MRLLYLIGVPGAGKSTLLKHVLAGVPAQVITGRIPHVVYGDGKVAQIGAMRKEFSGTDALQMSIQPKAVAWLSGEPYPNVIGEGDRLGNAKFFGSVKDLGIDLSVVAIQAPYDVAHQRRLARGSNQDPTWVRGRISKVEKLIDLFCDEEWVLDGTLPVEQLADILRTHPVLKPLEGQRA